MQPEIPFAAPAEAFKREPKNLNETALDLTLEWIRRSSEASELAVNDAKLAEVQAHAVARFFNVVRLEIAASFDKAAPDAPPSPERPA